MAKWLGPGSLTFPNGNKYGPNEDIDGDDLRSLKEERRNQLIDKGMLDGNKKKTEGKK